MPPKNRKFTSYTNERVSSESWYKYYNLQCLLSTDKATENTIVDRT